MKKSYKISLILIVALSLFAISSAKAATSLTQYGITWTFSANVTAGQFANGDWWVVGPVTITDISPRTIPGQYGVNKNSNGTMLNPIPNQSQGLYRWDDPASFSYTLPAYDALKNISLQLPFNVAPGNSVFSTVDNPDTWATAPNNEKTYFKETAILTVLAVAPPAGSFRPPYAGTDKTIKSNWKVSSINYGALRSLVPPVPSNVPNRVWMENATQRPLLEMRPDSLNSSWKSSWAESKAGGYPRRTYGREIAHISGGASLLLNTNLSNATKEKLAINMIQWGIDTYGLLNNGMQYYASGGHQNGRLLPVFMAGKLLGDADILARASGKSYFQEVVQHYFITQADIDRPKVAHTPPNKPWTQDQLGMPEWSSGGRYDNDTASASWDGLDGYFSVGYRFVNGAPNCGTVAAILLMGGRSDINLEAFMRYHMERYYPRQRPTGNGAFEGDGNGIQCFTRDMWDTYISGGTIPPVDPSTPPSKVTGVKVVK